MTTPQITGPDGSSTTLRDIASFRRRRLHVLIYLRSYELTPGVVRLPPQDRHGYLARRAQRWLRYIKQSFPVTTFVVSSNRQIPIRVSATLTTQQLRALVGLDGIQFIRILSHGPTRAKRKAGVTLSWFTVRARVAVQIEGQRQGRQTIEDRFILLRASSCRDAAKRLRSEWREYAKPYLNPSGELVRWRFEEVTDCYRLFEDEIDAKGTEVYSELRFRSMNRSRAWIR